MGKIIFNEKAQVREVFPLIPADHVFFETDEWNQPVDKIYMEFARLSGMSLEKLSDQVMWNFRQVFLRQ
jgi:Tat protein secretion system quality control protein TatD with DNase activity